MKKRIISMFFAFLLLLSLFPLSVFAIEPSSDEPQEIDMSKTSIEYDFENIFFGAYDVEDYKPSSLKSQRQVIAFTEHINASGEIELYFYLYNPRQIPIYNTGENKVTLSCSTGVVNYETYTKYDIEKIDAMYFSKNLAGETNASLIKYKVSGFSLKTDEALRSYSISELELRLKNGVLPITVGKNFTFFENADGTLDVVTSGQSVIEIEEIGHTYYRVLGDKTTMHQDIRTVYFAVEKDIVNKYGLMDSVNVSWEEKDLQPILLLDNQSLVDEFKKIIGETDLSNFDYSFGAGLRPGLLSAGLGIGHLGTEFQIGFNTSEIPDRFYAGTNYYFNGILDNLVWSDYYHNLNVGNFDGETYDNVLEKLYFVFYCDYLEKSTVSGETLLYAADIYDGKFDGLYSDELFTSSEFFNVTYRVGEESSLNKYKVDTNIINYVLNGWKYTTEKVDTVEFSRFEMYDVNSSEKAYESFKEFSENMLGFDAEAFYNNYLHETYLIDSNDVANFREFVERNKDSYIYFIRYSVTDTEIYEASVFGDTYLRTGIDIVDEYLPQAECYACNGSFVKTTMVNDFDIITIGFDDLRGGYTVVPASSTPTDHIPDVSQIEKKLPDEPVGNDIQNLIDTIKTIIIVVIAMISLLIVSSIVLIVVLIVKIFKRKRGKNREKKNN